MRIKSPPFAIIIIAIMKTEDFLCLSDLKKVKQKKI